MHTSITKRVGLAVAATVVTGALVVGGAATAQAYGAKNMTVSLSSTAPKAKATVTANVTYLKPGTTPKLYTNNHSYAGSKATDGTPTASTIKFPAPSLAGKYTYKVLASGEPSYSGSYKVGTILSFVSISTGVIHANQTFKVVGGISTHKAGAKTTVAYRSSTSSSYHTIGTTVTTSAGKYSKSVKIGRPGTYYLKVTITRDANFTAVTKTIKITVH